MIPPVLSLFTLLRSYLAHFPPVFSRFLRVFTVSPRRFQRAPSRNPGPRNGGTRTKTRDLGPSFDAPEANQRINWQRSLAFSSDRGQSWSNATDVTAAPGGLPYSSATCQGSLAEVGRQLVAAHPSTRNGSCPHLRCNLSLWTAPVLGRGDGWGLRSGFGSGSDTPLLGQWQPRVSLDRGYSAYSTLLPTPTGGCICAYEFSQTCELFKPPRCTAVPGSSGIMVASVEGLAVPYKTDDARRGLFARRWSKGVAALDCNSYTASLPFGSLPWKTDDRSAPNCSAGSTVSIGAYFSGGRMPCKTRILSRFARNCAECR